jgi:hypothetical protein
MGGKPVAGISIGTSLRPCSINGFPESLVWKMSALGKACNLQVLALICDSMLAEQADSSKQLTDAPSILTVIKGECLPDVPIEH